MREDDVESPYIPPDLVDHLNQTLHLTMDGSQLCFQWYQVVALEFPSNRVVPFGTNRFPALVQELRGVA